MAKPTSATRSAQFAKATLSIGGMTCTNCSNDVRSGLDPMKIVQSCNVSSMTDSGTVVFDQTRATALSEIVKIIEDKGYECTVRSIEPIFDKEEQKEGVNGPTDRLLRRIHLIVQGLESTNCLEKLESELSAFFGQEISVEQRAEQTETVLTLSYSPQATITTIRSIIQYIQKTIPSGKIKPWHPPTAEDESRRIQQKERRKISWRLILAIIIAVPTLFIGMIFMNWVADDDPIRVYLEAPFLVGNSTRSQWALLLLATPVYFMSASGFHSRAVKEIYSLWRRESQVPVLRRLYRFGSMNLLISAGITVAYFASIASLIMSATSTTMEAGATYFESVVFLTGLILTGKFIEFQAKAHAGNAIAELGKLRPSTATLVMQPQESSQSDEKDPVNSSCDIAVDLLEIGDVVIVPQGSTAPADGFLLSEEGRFDEGSLTGESKPVRKLVNDKVFLGTNNIGDSVKMVVIGVDGVSLLDQIIDAVREGQTKRAPVEKVADSITGYFVPVITLLAILTFFIWFTLGESGFLDSRYLKGASGGWGFWSLGFAITVFIIACPCGIGLAAPAAITVGTGMAAKSGILVRGGGEAFQSASNIDAIIFDKTGTLTEGVNAAITDVQMFDQETRSPQNILWTVARALEENSTHPIAQAIVKAAEQHSVSGVEVFEVTEIAGKGMRGVFISREVDQSRTFEVILGSEALLTSRDGVLSQAKDISRILLPWKVAGKSIAVLALRETQPHATWKVGALFGLSDPIRPSAPAAIAALKSRGIKVYMSSGDNPETARAVALAVGIPVAHVSASELPHDKAVRVNQLKMDLASEMPRKWYHKDSVKFRMARVAFVGDGINDALALLAADVSISMGSGSQIAVKSSSFILLGSSLESIVTLLDLSRKVFRRIKWNFAWAMMYNIVFIPMAAGVFFRVKEDGFIMPPYAAAIAMAFSSCSVLLASVAMRWGL